MASAGRKLGAARHWAWLLAGTIFLSIVVVSLFQGRFGQPGPDGDDVMRLVQIRDLLAGQGWFDLNQYRLGPDGGTLMHWSRIPDIPILVLTGMFDLFLPQETALAWAISVWPPLSILIVIAGLMLAARHAGRDRLLLFVFIVAVPVLFAHFRFLSGAIDHHNLQLGFLAVAVGASLDRQGASRSMALSAAVLALSVAVGIELYPFVAVMCAFHALEWALRGEAVKRGAVTFGLTLAGTAAACFFATVPPALWGRVYCDSYSIISFLALAIGGTGLALVAVFLSGRGRLERLGGLAGVGIACGILFVVQGPQCLANPLDVLEPDVRDIWFNSITEARPMFAQEGGRWPFVAYAMGTSLVAFAVSVTGIIKKQDVRTHILFSVLLAMAIILMLYQVRFYVFGSLLAIVPCAIWVERIYTNGREEGSSKVAYLAPLVLSNPALWALLPTFLAPMNQDQIPDTACLSETTLEALGSVAPGMVLSDANTGAFILNETSHSVMSANYHRDTSGIGGSLKAFGLPTEEVPGLLTDNQVDYVLLCPGAPENRTFARLRPDGFLARLVAGDIPSWLKPAGPAPEDENSGRLYIYAPDN